MNHLNSAATIRRYYVHATEQQLFGSGVDYATSVEYITEKQMFLIHNFYRQATEWIVNESAEWAEKFTAKHNIIPIELFTQDVVRNEEYAVYITHNCARRIYTQEIHKIFEGVMQSIGYSKPCYWRI
jgi:hypothetical protein